MHLWGSARKATKEVLWAIRDGKVMNAMCKRCPSFSNDGVWTQFGTKDRSIRIERFREWPANVLQKKKPIMAGKYKSVKVIFGNLKHTSETWSFWPLLQSMARNLLDEKKSTLIKKIRFHLDFGASPGGILSRCKQTCSPSLPFDLRWPFLRYLPGEGQLSGWTISSFCPPLKEMCYLSKIAEKDTEKHAAHAVVLERRESESGKSCKITRFCPEMIALLSPADQIGSMIQEYRMHRRQRCGGGCHYLRSGLHS